MVQEEIMKTFTFSEEDQQRIVVALENHISDIRLYNKKERNRLRFKTTKNLVQRRSDQRIIDQAEEKIVGIKKIVDEIKATLVAWSLILWGRAIR